MTLQNEKNYQISSWKQPMTELAGPIHRRTVQ